MRVKLCQQLFGLLLSHYCFAIDIVICIKLAGALIRCFLPAQTATVAAEPSYEFIGRLLEINLKLK